MWLNIKKGAAMTKTQIEKWLSQGVKGKIVISAEKVAFLMTMRKADAIELCEGCNYDNRNSKRRYYYIEDVAEKLAARRGI